MSNRIDFGMSHRDFDLFLHQYFQTKFHSEQLKTLWKMIESIFLFLRKSFRVFFFSLQN